MGSCISVEVVVYVSRELCTSALAHGFHVMLCGHLDIAGETCMMCTSVSIMQLILMHCAMSCSSFSGEAAGTGSAGVSLLDPEGVQAALRGECHRGDWDRNNGGIKIHRRLILV